MPTITSNMMERLARLKSERKHRLLFVFMAVLVTVATAVALKQIGVALTRTETVLDCPFEGVAAHTHTSDCYDDDGNLVCPLPERELHVHDESCYTETRELVCDLEESAGHTHTETCYDADGNLVCGQEESAGHTHTDDCYEVTRELTCGKEELTEEHVHGPGCFRTVKVTEDDDAEEDDIVAADTSDDSSDTPTTSTDDAMPQQHFSKRLKNEDGKAVLVVEVEAPEGALPADSKMVAKLIADDDLSTREQAAVKRAVAKKTDGVICAMQAVDISFRDAEGEEVEPAKKIVVTLTSELVDTNDQAHVVHVDDLTKEQAKAMAQGGKEPKRNAEVVDALSKKQLDKRDMVLDADQLAFESDQFSTYVLAVSTLRKQMTASDGTSYVVEIDASAAAGIPADAELQVNEITEASRAWESCADQAIEALGDNVSFAKLLDISIVSGGAEIQPTEPVSVSIKLTDGTSLSSEAQALHFGADGVEVLDANVSDDTVSFEADGFSAYAIVTGPEAVDLGWTKVTSVDDLDTTGFYIGHTSGYYFMDETVKDGTRIGIKKTMPSNGNPTDAAVLYYFERVGTTDQFYVYCMDGQNKKYVTVNTGTRSLYFADNADGKTAFTITKNNDGSFYIKTGNWYWNMQGGATGLRFCIYNQANDPNSTLYIWNQLSDVASDPYELDGKSYGLMYWNETLYGKAMMASAENEDALDAKALMVTSTQDNSSQLFVPNDSDISMWTFHWDHDDYYYLTATVEGSTKYLKVDANGVSLADTPDAAGQIRVVPGTGAHAGEIYLKSNGATLTYSGSAENGFVVGGSAGAEWLHLVKLSELTSDYYKTYSARKVSVSDPSITTGSKVIVYTRVWNETALKYEYYAINHDGTLVRCFESGDSIEWCDGIINTMLWRFTEYTDDNGEPTNYYELFNEYAEKYLAPQLTGSQIVADDPIGINMNGRRNGRYSSTILAWDNDSYSYTGLKVQNGQIVSCPKAKALDFYFAVMSDIPVDGELTNVETVNNTEHGITMRMVDLASRNQMSDFLGSNAGGVGTKLQQGLLSTELGENGFPMVTKEGGQSLGVLYNGSQDVNHLFIESIYDESGYFEFDSSQNFASLQDDVDGDGLRDFVVYKELGSYDTGGDRETLKHGQFLPYNDIEPGVFASTNPKNLYSATADPLSDDDPRKYENLHLVQNANLQFAMNLEASFTQTPEGLDDWGHDIIFEFTGDDDFWLYVDGELVIDLGGIHSAVPGSVNFSTGNVNVNGTQTTLRALFESNFRKRNPNATNDMVVAFLEEKGFKGNSSIFDEYTTHTMSIFYMERGGGASNLHMRFNLASVKPGTVELSKTLDGVDASESTLAEFAYQVKYKLKGDNTEHYLTNAVSRTRNTEDHVFYKGSEIPVTFSPSKNIGGVTYENVFILKPDETVVINFPVTGVGNDRVESYSIVECGVNTQVYSNVAANGTDLDGTAIAGHADRKDFGIDYASTEDRQRVSYVNTVDPEAMRTLTFTKKLFDADGTTPITNDSTVFDFRLYLGTDSDTELAPAYMYTYHVKDAEGNYCRWDAASKAFVKLGDGMTDYTELTDEQKEAVSFNTSVYGSIASIPVDHTVEVRQLLAGTNYRVQERADEIPDGYSFQKYVYYADVEDANATKTYSGGDAVATAGAPDDEYNTIVAGEDPHVDICNLKGWGLRTNKVWTDANYMSDRATTYFAVYTKKQHGEGAEHGHGYGLEDYVPGSLRAMPYGTTTLYWYWLRLPVSGVPFDDYVIREVEILSGTPVVDEDGVVTNADDLHFQWLREGDPISLVGTQKGEETSGTFNYTVRYEQGTISPESNVRVDTITNDRPGIILKKEDWSGNALAGASFKLTDANGTEIGTFTSDEDGFITTAFLTEGKDYTLTETSAPQSYHGLESSLTICADGGRVSVDGVEKPFYDLTQAQGTTPATLVIKNHPYTFQAIKKDGTTDAVLEGVHFELHKQVTAGGVTAFDEAVMTGYENLITDENGVLPKIDNTLPAGTYQLREKESITGYQEVPGHVEFTVSKNGAITLLSPTGSDAWASLDDTTDYKGTINYVLNILNYQRADITLIKHDDKGAALVGASFKLCARTTGGVWGAVPGYEDIDMTTLSETSLAGLTPGLYKLMETEAPSGYVIQLDAVYFNLAFAADGSFTVTLTDEEGEAASYDLASIGDDGATIIVENTPGVALPVTGGSGTTFIYLVGTMMVGLAGALLIKRRGAID